MQDNKLEEIKEQIKKINPRVKSEDVQQEAKTS